MVSTRFAAICKNSIPDCLRSATYNMRLAIICSRQYQVSYTLICKNNPVGIRSAKDRDNYHVHVYVLQKTCSIGYTGLARSAKTIQFGCDLQKGVSSCQRVC